MNELTFLITLGTVHLVALASPGPDFALVVQNASRHGRRIGLAIAMGISLAILLHATLALTGVSLLIQQQPLLSTLLRLAGGSYLLYLGIGALKGFWGQRAKTPTSAQNLTAPQGNPAPLLPSARQALLKGFTTNLLNPKALVFFLSLLTSLVPPATPVWSKGAAVLLLWTLSLGWFSALAWLLTGQRLQRRIARAAPYIDGVCGALFLLLGGGILVTTLV
ncbi:LysE family translocator [Ferrimonas gelatinilytica]|uniref:LysE family translocator n=1 Tax=Ferrimonas gelatinilytica TaxID=1255257 RepID=A0ABP9S6U7_9GAMM